MQTARVCFTNNACHVEHMQNQTLKVVVKEILHRSHPIILGVKILNGTLKPGIVLRAHVGGKQTKYIGEVLSLEVDEKEGQKDILSATSADGLVSMKVDSHNVDVHVHHDLVGKELTEAHLRLEVMEIFHRKDPMILGVKVKEGAITPGTVLETADHKVIGEVASIEKDHENIDIAASKDGEIGVKVVPTEDTEVSPKKIHSGEKVVDHADDHLDMTEDHIIHASDPIILSVKVNHGVLREGDFVELVQEDFVAGKVVSIEREHKKIHSASASDEMIGIQIQPTHNLDKLLKHKHSRKNLKGTHITKAHHIVPAVN